MDEIVRDACELFDPLAADRSLALRCAAAAGVSIKGDISMIQRMIANLIDNAVKYTPPGGRIDVTARSDTDSRVVISVEDTGTGISADDLPHIFDRFFRCDPSRSTSGSGLGLSLVKAVAEAHNGHVAVSSTINQGSCFTVILPAEIVPAEATPHR